MKQIVVALYRTFIAMDWPEIKAENLSKIREVLVQEVIRKK